MKSPIALPTKIVRFLAAPILASVLITGSLRAHTVMVSNLDEESMGAGAFVNTTISSAPYVLNVASDFTTGEVQTTLHSITIRFGEYSAGAGFSLSLYSDDVGLPGSLIETLTGDDAPNDAADYTYTSFGATLEAGTT